MTYVLLLIPESHGYAIKLATYKFVNKKETWTEASTLMIENNWSIVNSTFKSLINLINLLTKAGIIPKNTFYIINLRRDF